MISGQEQQQTNTKLGASSSSNTFLLKNILDFFSLTIIDGCKINQMNILQGCPNLVCSLREDAEGKGKSVESPIKSFNENRLQINGSNFYVKFLSPPLKQEERSCNKGFVFNWAKTIFDQQIAIDRQQRQPLNGFSLHHVWWFSLTWLHFGKFGHKRCFRLPLRSSAELQNVLQSYIQVDDCYLCLRKAPNLMICRCWWMRLRSRRLPRGPVRLLIEDHQVVAILSSEEYDTSSSKRQTGICHK